MVFSIIVVALNAGDKLLETLGSIEKQTCKDVEVIIKDGGSKDGSQQKLQEYLADHPAFASHIAIHETPDKSIYDGMNQAVSYASGEYLYFLNCGDSFYHEDVLTEVEKAIRGDRQKGESHKIYYGNIYDMLQETVVASNPHMDAFACYRNVPCHQACFYHASLFEKRGYKTEYKVRGDYEHFLWCFFEEKAEPAYVPVVIANYEGGGYSETKENLRRSKREHKEITALYMSGRQRFYYKSLLLLTLAPLRTWMSHNSAFSGLYNRIKQMVYGSGQDNE
ncbi:MAG: glycosyltransferase [Lachnospiraceae bacterium]